MLHTIYLIIKSYRKDELKKRQTKPIILGASSVLLGQVLFLAPFCKGFPIDVLSALIMVICLGYALYKRRLFKLTLLVSKGACYAVSAVLSVLFFSYWLPSMDGMMRKTLIHFPISETMMIALLFMICTVILYNLMKICIDKLFIKDEIQRANALKEFSHDVSQSLRINEIMDKMVRLLRDSLDIQKIFVFVQNTKDQDYDMAYSLSPLDNRSFKLDHKNPLIKYLESNHECLLMSDFQCMTVYRSMWEEEKNQFAVMHTDCFIPLNDDDTLVGVVAVSLPAGKRNFSFDDLSFLSSISSICSIAVKNSRLYEQAYYEARTDEMTGLYNRKYFYEILEKEYSRCEGRSLALIVFNMDDFRLYNQLYGTKEGDLALQRTARAISSCVGDNGYTTRYSSKVFSVILPGYDMLAAKNLADTIRRQIMHINDNTNDKILKVLTMSIGISSIPYTASSISELIDTADMAVFNVKRKGKNGIMLAAGGQIMRDTQTYRNTEQGHEHREEIYSAYASTIYALTAAIDTKDHYTFNHSKNVAYYASELAYATGLDADTVEIIREAGLLHDVGKIGIPETVLNKPGKLTEEEFEIMVYVDPPEKGSNFKLSVADNGIGMSEEFRMTMFEPFTQEKRVETDAATGTGLGLSIVKKYVDLMGGTVEVKSKINSGTEVTVMLPLQGAAENDEVLKKPAVRYEMFAGKHALLIEDNDINAEIALLLLGDAGVITDRAADGKAGLEMFAGSTDGYYDFILMDIRMPVMNGFEAAAAIRGMDRTDAADVPVIAMTADAFEESMTEARNAGMNDYIIKPVDRDAMFRTIAENIEK